MELYLNPIFIKTIEAEAKQCGEDVKIVALECLPFPPHRKYFLLINGQWAMQTPQYPDPNNRKSMNQLRYSQRIRWNIRKFLRTAENLNPHKH